MKKKALKIFLIFMGCMLILTLISRGIYAYTLPRVSTISISTIALDHSVRGEGCVEKKNEAPICILPGIRIDEICVKEGEKVKEGDTLLRLNEEDLKEYIASLQTEVTTLALQISDAKNNAALAASEKQKEIDRASADYNTTASQYDRKISEAGADLQRAIEARDVLGSRDSYKSTVSGNDPGNEWDSLYKPLDEAVISAQRAYDDAVEAKNNAMVNAGRKLEDTQTPAASDSTSKSTSLLLAEKKATMEKYQSLLENGVDIVSDTDGIISALNIKPGDITPQTASLLIATISENLTFSASVSKEALKYISVGDHVTLGFHSGADKTDDALVTSINQEDTSDSYQLEVTFDSALASIGETGNFTVKSFSADKSICVPLTALHSDGMMYYVYVMNTKNSILGEELTATLRKVTIADKNDTYAALESSGLTSEDAIIISSTKPLTDGKTVRLLTE